MFRTKKVRPALIHLLTLIIILFLGCNKMDTSSKDELHEGAMFKKVVKDFLDFSTGKQSGYKPLADDLSILKVKSMDTPTRDRLLVDLAIPITIPAYKIKRIAIKRGYAFLTDRKVDVVKVRIFPQGFPQLGGILGIAIISTDDRGWDGKEQPQKFKFIPFNKPWKTLKHKEIQLLTLLEEYYEKGLKNNLDKNTAQKAAINSVAKQTGISRNDLTKLVEKTKRFFYHPE